MQRYNSLNSEMDRSSTAWGKLKFELTSEALHRTHWHSVFLCASRRQSSNSDTKGINERKDLPKGAASRVRRRFALELTIKVQTLNVGR